MGSNVIFGRNQDNENIWTIEQLKGEAYGDSWIGTDRKNLLVRFGNAQDGIAFFLALNPTDTISGTIDNTYRFAMPAQSEHKTILDSILKELGL